MKSSDPGDSTRYEQHLGEMLKGIPMVRLVLNDDGSPGHPLYLKATLPIVPYFGTGSMKKISMCPFTGSSSAAITFELPFSVRVM